MNDLQKAKNFIGKLHNVWLWKPKNKKQHELLNIAEAALDKQIPKKVRWTPAFQSYYSAGDEAESFCPVCDEEVEEDQDNYCRICGTKLEYHSSVIE